VLTASLPAESQAFLDKYSSRITKLWVAGGTSAIDDATVTAATAAAQNTANDNATNTTVTSLPELVSATIVKTTGVSEATTASPAGTTVRYTFDEAVLTAPAANAFKVYNAAGGAITGDTATIETGGTSVIVNFGSLTTAASNASLTVATVIRGAVQDTGGNPNPEGDAAIGVPASTTTGTTAGITSAPDLVSVGGFRTSATGTATIVDFTFDQAATITGVGAVGSEGASAFSLVTVAGTELTCLNPTATNTVPGGGTTQGGSGTTTISVECGTAGLTSAGFARGTVNTGAVQSVATSPVANVLSAADIGSGTSTSPDLVSASFNLTTSRVVYTFDQAVTSTTLASYGVYNAAGTQSFTGTLATVNTAGGSTQVAVDFPAGTLTNAIGAVVRDSAVTATSNSQPNQQDEVGVSNASTSAQTPGFTSGPDLASVAITKGTADAFGVQPNQATYTFDSAATAATTVNNPALFHLYSAAGVRLTGATCAAGNGSTTGALNTVTCTAYTSTDAVTPLNTQYSTAVLGTVEAGAVTVSSVSNPEGGAPTTGGTGTAVNP